ncbi:MAG: UDP-N-acetylglucosamine--N-acetylmuramyl-(pentapeptide) pyrophosphoryl-undecaprenol N-acetylglucosamine transferase [Candidatus Peribacteraceae bacterium]|nr:UDP-N-acetylglucosamine--N-acetylmuramyl-(pentapeptide) pyrophosphoryl-undecaprenol N-acetylglucosamine transferase [Candidatus Peribacteraceae bacterium]
MKILFVGGGSVGHIAPSKAVWEECKQLIPDAEAHFVCSPRPDDAKFLQSNDLAFSILDAPRAPALRSPKDVVGSLLFPFKFVSAVKRAKKILEEQNPNLIFSKGSYVSLPLCFAAKKKKIPIIAHDSDAVSGYANKIVAKWANHICTGFPSKSYKLIANSYTGNPIRKEITEGSKEEGLRITGFDGSKPILLVIGGSQGAKALNEAITNQLDDLLIRCDIIHITGRKKLHITENLSPTTDHYYRTEFANEELAHFYAAADLALSRAGANSIADLAANGIPTILVPLRNVGHDHQYKNVLVAKKHGCIHLEQSTLPEKLLPTVHGLIADKEKRQNMSASIQKFGKPDAALQIAKIIAQTLDS